MDTDNGVVMARGKGGAVAEWRWGKWGYSWGRVSIIEVRLKN